MQLSDLLTPDRVASTHASSKKRVLEQLSQLIFSGQDNVSQTEIFDSLISRERLGSTGLGHGVAIPHGRVRNSDRTIGAFIKLDQGIDFDAIDREPVDLLFALLVPEHCTDEHLQLLAQLAEMFSDPQLLEKLRQASNGDSLFHIIEHWQATH